MYPCCAMVPCLLYTTLYMLLIAFSLYHRNIKVDILANPVGLKQWDKGKWTSHGHHRRPVKGARELYKQGEGASQVRRQEELGTASMPTCPDPGSLKKMAPTCRQRAPVSSQLLTSCWSPTLTVSGEDWKLRPLCSYLSVSGSQPWAQDLSTSQKTSAGGQSFQSM